MEGNGKHGRGMETKFVVELLTPFFVGPTGVIYRP